MKITVEQASKLLGISKQCLRVAMQRKNLPIGFEQLSDGKAKRRYYYISPKMLANYIGISIEVLKERLA